MKRLLHLTCKKILDRLHLADEKTCDFIDNARMDALCDENTPHLAFKAFNVWVTTLLQRSA
jgi:hypothetical protein